MTGGAGGADASAPGSRAARVCLLGPSGRMGREIIAHITHRDGDRDDARADLALVSAVDHPDAVAGIAAEMEAAAAARGVLPRGVQVGADLARGLAAADVYIDFTTPDATVSAARIAARIAADRATGAAARGDDAPARPVAAVIGTTGLDAGGHAAIDALAEVAPVVFAPNFSLGVNVLFGLAARAARALGPGFDLEVVEIHHRAKRDAPSGTALALAGALAEARDLDPEQALRCAREGEVGPRPSGEIGVVAVRGGDVAGEHTALFLGPGERLEITHRAVSREIFAAGAVRAAAWVAAPGRAPGRYAMTDVLGL